MAYIKIQSDERKRDTEFMLNSFSNGIKGSAEYREAAEIAAVRTREALECMKKMEEKYGNR